jgi:hypothetical protein
MLTRALLLALLLTASAQGKGVTQAWEVVLAEKGADYSARRPPPLLVGELLVVSYEATLHVVDAKLGKLLRKIDTPDSSRINKVDVLENASVLVLSKTHMLIVDVARGRVLWKLARTELTPGWRHRLRYVTDRGDLFLLLDKQRLIRVKSTGKVAWTANLAAFGAKLAKHQAKLRRVITSHTSSWRRPPHVGAKLLAMSVLGGQILILDRKRGRLKRIIGAASLGLGALRGEAAIRYQEELYVPGSPPDRPREFALGKIDLTLGKAVALSHEEKPPTGNVVYLGSFEHRLLTLDAQGKTRLVPAISGRPILKGAGVVVVVEKAVKRTGPRSSMRVEKGYVGLDLKTGKARWQLERGSKLQVFLEPIHASRRLQHGGGAFFVMSKKLTRLDLRRGELKPVVTPWNAGYCFLQAGPDSDTATCNLEGVVWGVTLSRDGVSSRWVWRHGRTKFAKRPTMAEHVLWPSAERAFATFVTFAPKKRFLVVGLNIVSKPDKR